MLKIICGDEPEYLLNTSRYLFELENTREWFEDPLVQEMVLDVDKTEHIKGAVFESPVLGPIMADQLSGGVKGLILILKSKQLRDYRAMRSSIFGDNCVKWLIKLSYITDFTIYMSHYLDFYFGGNYSKSFNGYHNTPINAVGANGEILSTCSAIMEYYADNDTFEYDYTNFNRELEESRLREEIDKYKDPEYFAKAKEMAPYLVSLDHPFSIAYMDLLAQLQVTKSTEETESILEQINNLYSKYFVK